MADSPEEIHGIEQIRRWITEEVHKQVEPLTNAVGDIKEQNRVQNNLLTMQEKSLREVGNRLRGLWGNGTGPPGYIENARAEDKVWKEQMFEKLSVIEAEKYREEGEKRLLGEQEEQKDRRLGRWKTYAYIAASFGGAWFWTLIRPLVHSFVNYLAG